MRKPWNGLVASKSFVVGKGGTIEMIVILMINFQIFVLKEGNSFLTCNEHCKEDMRGT